MGREVAMQGGQERKVLKDERKMRWRKEERWFNRKVASNRCEERS